MNKTLTCCTLLLLGILWFSGCRPPESGDRDTRPNILFVISDDQSYPHASAYGSTVVSTPAFDRVAERGVLFTQAFVAAPQCSPSRAAILTGRPIWQLEEAGTHSSYFPSKFPVFTQVLENSGYAVGYTGKAWGPGNWQDAGWSQNPVGRAFNDIRFDSLPARFLSRIDYASNFEAFLKTRDESQPFFFWFGSQEPHRDYEQGAGSRDRDVSAVEVPAFLPDHDTVRSDLLDYAFELAWYDQQLGKMLSLLERTGELENTLIIITADNGMAFPYAKANLQEYGIHVPLAICGPGIRGGRTVHDLVSLIDLAPTILDVSRVGTMEGMTGRSLASILTGNASGVADPSRRYILSGRERHTHARPDNYGYPARALRTAEYLYIRNFKPDRWPMGDPPPAVPLEDPEAAPVVQGYEDIDDSPTKRLLITGRAHWPQLFDLAVGMRQAEQLYDIRNDPGCLVDLASDSTYADVLRELRDTLEHQLVLQGDPRVLGSGDVFETYPRFGRMRAFPGFRKRGAYNRPPDL